MKNNLTINDLKERKFDVKIEHIRFKSTLLHPLAPPILVPEYRKNLWGEEIYPRGGFTVVTITEPDGESFEGYAKCSLADGFNRKKGLTLALGRALGNQQKRRKLDLAGFRQYIEECHQTLP